MNTEKWIWLEGISEQSVKFSEEAETWFLELQSSNGPLFLVSFEKEPLEQFIAGVKAARGAAK